MAFHPKVLEVGFIFLVIADIWDHGSQIPGILAPDPIRLDQLARYCFLYIAWLNLLRSCPLLTQPWEAGGLPDVQINCCQLDGFAACGRR
jgi:hypothetical protein